MKTCKDCMTRLPDECFAKCAKTKDGLYTYCRTCAATRKKAYRQANPEKDREWAAKNRDRINASRKGKRKPATEKDLERVRAWHAANREHVREQSRKRYEENKEAILAQQRVYYEQNRDRILDRQRRSPEENRAHVKAWVEANPGKRRAMLQSQRDRLIDSYVRRRLIQGTALSATDIPQGLIDAKREQLRILRELRKEDHEER